jgi:hypothetical protein
VKSDSPFIILCSFKMLYFIEYKSLINLLRLEWSFTVYMDDVIFYCAHMYCISSASERKHEIACTSWSSCRWKLCELVSNIEEQLSIVFMYTGDLSIFSTISQFESDLKMCTFHLMGHKNNKKYDGRGNSDYPNHRSWKQNGEREKQKIHAWQWKGELGSDEIALFLTLPWKMC